MCKVVNKNFRMFLMKAHRFFSQLFLNTNSRVFFIAILCLTLRLLFFSAIQPWQTPVKDNFILIDDAEEYHNIAISLLNIGRFALDSNAPTDGLRTPVYPYYISSLYFLFGQNPWVVLLSQIFLDTFSCAFLYLFCKKLFGAKTAFIASLFYAFDPFLIFYSSALLSDTLFVFLCILSFFFFSKWLVKKKEKKFPIYIVLSALFLGVATLDRPIGIYLPIIFVLFIVIHHRSKFKKALFPSLLFVASFFITLSPWLIRNLLFFNTLSLSTSQNYNLLILDIIPMEMARTGMDEPSVKISLLNKVDSLMRHDNVKVQGLNEFQRTNYYKKLALIYIKENPFAFSKHYMLGVGHSMFNLNTHGFAQALRQKKSNEFDIKKYSNPKDLINAFWQHKSSIEKVFGITVFLFLVISYILAVCGFFEGIKRTKEYSLYCFVLAAYFVILTGTAGLSRFKLPAIPFYSCFVGLGSSRFLTRRSKTLRPNVSLFDV